VFRGRVLACSLMVAHATRITKSETSNGMDSFNPHVGGAEGCVFPDSLKKKYSKEWVIGTGATACVWIADVQGSPVAIKIAKGGGKISEWRKECDDMQQMRLAACRGGSQAQQLAEQFLPTCLEVGSAGSVSFYVMQAAGATGISDFARKTAHDLPLQKRAFAQTVAAVYSMHGIDYTHNDLHGHNIVLDASNDVALIDFGEIKGHHRGIGYKHDVNSIWRWAASLAHCPESAQFPRLMKSFFSQKNRQELAERKAQLMACLKVKWSVDDRFVHTFDSILSDVILIKEDQRVRELFDTEFVQENLPPLKNAYPWDGNGKCKASGLAKKQHVGLKAKKQVGGTRPTVGDRVRDAISKKCVTIIKDDKDSVPYKVKLDDGTVERLQRRVVQVAWAPECL